MSAVSLTPPSIRSAGYLAILIGTVGTFAGLSGASTFIPFRVSDHLTLAEAETLTAISAVAAIVSVWNLTSGWGLLVRRGWAGTSAVASTLTTIGVVAVFALLMPSSSPSPVPGGAGVWVLFSVVAVACSLELLVLYLGRGGWQAEPTKDRISLRRST